MSRPSSQTLIRRSGRLTMIQRPLSGMFSAADNSTPTTPASGIRNSSRQRARQRVRLAIFLPTSFTGFLTYLMMPAFEEALSFKDRISGAGRQSLRACAVPDAYFAAALLVAGAFFIYGPIAKCYRTA